MVRFSTAAALSIRVRNQRLGRPVDFFLRGKAPDT
jgi:hypothetical protein